MTYPKHLCLGWNVTTLIQKNKSANRSSVHVCRRVMHVALRIDVLSLRYEKN